MMKFFISLFSLLVGATCIQASFFTEEQKPLLSTKGNWNDFGPRHLTRRQIEADETLVHKKSTTKVEVPTSLDVALEQVLHFCIQNELSCNLEEICKSLLPYIDNRGMFVQKAMFGFRIPKPMATNLYKGLKEEKRR
jgi:hypothetical protein